MSQLHKEQCAWERLSCCRARRRPQKQALESWFGRNRRCVCGRGQGGGQGGGRPDGGGTEEEEEEDAGAGGGAELWMWVAQFARKWDNVSSSRSASAKTESAGSGASEEAHVEGGLGGRAGDGGGEG